MLYLIYAESANYCGYGQHFVVKAEDETEAEFLASPHIDEYFYEQDQDQLEEEGIDDCMYGHVVSVEEFNEGHDAWKFYQDPSQEEFYIKVNF